MLKNVHMFTPQNTRKNVKCNHESTLQATAPPVFLCIIVLQWLPLLLHICHGLQGQTVCGRVRTQEQTQATDHN